MVDPPDLDVDRVVSTLDRHGVAYLLVGGVAARFHGASRPTQDIDLLPRALIERTSIVSRRRWLSSARSCASVA